MSKYYVYTYIDPRNLEEFYYGKGQGSRKAAHMFDVSDSVKARRIHDIRKAGLEPVIRVIAAGLTETEALLVEATLIWKLGRFTTNIAGGHFAGKFRPHDTYHLELSGFDYRNGITMSAKGRTGTGTITSLSDLSPRGRAGGGVMQSSVSSRRCDCRLSPPPWLRGRRQDSRSGETNPRR